MNRPNETQIVTSHDLLDDPAILQKVQDIVAYALHNTSTAEALIALLQATLGIAAAYLTEVAEDPTVENDERVKLRADAVLMFERIVERVKDPEMVARYQQHRAALLTAKANRSKHDIN